MGYYQGGLSPHLDELLAYSNIPIRVVIERKSSYVTHLPTKYSKLYSISHGIKRLLRDSQIIVGIGRRAL